MQEDSCEPHGNRSRNTAECHLFDLIRTGYQFIPIFSTSDSECFVTIAQLLCQGYTTYVVDDIEYLYLQHLRYWYYGNNDLLGTLSGHRFFPLLMFCVS